MKKVNDSSQAKQTSCAGSSYFFKQLKIGKDHYVVHDGAIEGIRNGCFDSEKMCDVHQTSLGCQCRGLPVEYLLQLHHMMLTLLVWSHYIYPDIFSELPKQKR